MTMMRSIYVSAAVIALTSIARSVGAQGETGAKTEEFLPALKRAAASGKAAVIELKVDPDLITARTTLTAIREKALAAKKGK